MRTHDCFFLPVFTLYFKIIVRLDPPLQILRKDFVDPIRLLFSLSAWILLFKELSEANDTWRPSFSNFSVTSQNAICIS